MKKRPYKKRSFKPKEIPQNLSMKEAFLKLASFCAYQERSYQEIYQKLKEWNITADDQATIVLLLEEENFLNEERFVRAFVRGKFNYKKWGKQKIRFALAQKGISNAIISIALDEEIEVENYYETLYQLLLKKWQDLEEEKEHFKRKQKTVTYALQKGFESNLVYEILSDIEKQH